VREFKSDFKAQAEQIIQGVSQETVVPWTEDFKPTGGWVTFDADMFTAWTHSLLPPAFARLVPDVRVPVGNMFFRNLVLPLACARFAGLFVFQKQIGVMRAALSMGPRRGSCSFNKPVCIPQIVENDGEIWMSLTPMEILTQRPGIRKARGNVLVGGMGMGWFARRCCERKDVKSVTVYEIDADVAQTFRFEHPKLKVVVGDVWKADPEAIDSVLLDVWDSYGSAEGHPVLCDWKARHPRVWAWGDIGDWAMVRSLY